MAESDAKGPYTQSWRRDMGAYRANCSCGWTSGPFFHEWRAVAAGEAHATHTHPAEKGSGDRCAECGERVNWTGKEWAHALDQSKTHDAAPARKGSHAPTCRWFEQDHNGATSCDCGAAGKGS